MNDRDKIVFNPWYFLLWVVAFGVAGRLTGGKVGELEGVLLAVTVAHGALIEALREKYFGSRDARKGM